MPLGASSWSPLLAGAEASRAESAVSAIAEGIVATPDPVHHPVAPLAGGDAGIALFFEALDRARPAEGYGLLAQQHLDQAVDGLAGGFQLPSLYSGFTGVAWVAEQLQPDGLADEDDANAAIDEALRRHVAQSPWRRDYDLTTGLVGFGLYALERWPRPAAVDCLEQVVARLAETAEPRPEGLTWHTRPELLPEHSRRTLPHGGDNLGVAHGVPGVIGLLARLAAVPVAADTVQRLLTGAVPWLLAQKLAADQGSVFPSVVGDEVVSWPARTAWCYGDPGIAIVLLAAARAAGRPDWEVEARALARAVASRPAARCGVQDAGLCHGAAGLAHLCNRLYQATGDPQLEGAARRWFRQTLDDRRPGEGIGGYLAWTPAADNSGRMSWVADPGFLTGAAGIGLALLAATTAIEPAWDRLLLASPLSPPSERS